MIGIFKRRPSLPLVQMNAELTAKLYLSQKHIRAMHDENEHLRAILSRAVLDPKDSHAYADLLLVRDGI